jgi:hypothetical protein
MELGRSAWRPSRRRAAASAAPQRAPTVPLRLMPILAAAAAGLLAQAAASPLDAVCAAFSYDGSPLASAAWPTANCSACLSAGCLFDLSTLQCAASPASLGVGDAGSLVSAMQDCPGACRRRARGGTAAAAESHGPAFLRVPCAPALAGAHGVPPAASSPRHCLRVFLRPSPRSR